MNSFQYRTFLTRNADELMDVNRGYACMKNCCGPCQEPYHSINTLPEVNKVKCNKNNCEIVGFDPNGLGRRFLLKMKNVIILDNQMLIQIVAQNQKIT